MTLAQDLAKIYGNDSDMIMAQAPGGGGNDELFSPIGGNVGQGQPSDSGFAGRLGTRFGQDFIQSFESDVDFLEGMRVPGADSLSDYIREYRESNWSVKPEDSALGQFVQDVAGAFGSMTSFAITLPFGPAGAATKVVKGAKGLGMAAKWAETLGRLVKVSPALILESITEAGGVYDQELRRSGDVGLAREKMLKTFGANAVWNSTIEAFTGVLNPGGATEKLLTRLLKTGLGEGVQEGGQTAWGDLILDGKTSWRDILYSAAIGAVPGATLGAITGEAKKRSDAQKASEQEQKLAEQDANKISGLQGDIEAFQSVQRQDAGVEVAPTSTGTSPETTRKSVETDGVYSEALGISPAEFGSGMVKEQTAETKEEKVDRERQLEENRQAADNVKSEQAEEKLLKQEELFDQNEAQVEAEAAQSAQERIVQLEADVEYEDTIRNASYSNTEEDNAIFSQSVLSITDRIKALGDKATPNQKELAKKLTTVFDLVNTTEPAVGALEKARNSLRSDLSLDMLSNQEQSSIFGSITKMQGMAAEALKAKNAESAGAVEKGVKRVSEAGKAETKQEIKTKLTPSKSLGGVDLSIPGEPASGLELGTDRQPAIAQQRRTEVLTDSKGKAGKAKAVGKEFRKPLEPKKTKPKILSRTGETQADRDLKAQRVKKDAEQAKKVAELDKQRESEKQEKRKEKAKGKGLKSEAKKEAAKKEGVSKLAGQLKAIQNRIVTKKGTAKIPKKFSMTKEEVAKEKKRLKRVIKAWDNQKGRKGEKITSPAVRYKGVDYTGALHPDIVSDIAEKTGDSFATVAGEGIDGYKTNKGRFLNRKSAETVAKKADQIREDAADAGYLDSQDLKKDKPTTKVPPKKSEPTKSTGPVVETKKKGKVTEAKKKEMLGKLTHFFRDDPDVKGTPPIVVPEKKSEKVKPQLPIKDRTVDNLAKRGRKATFEEEANTDTLSADSTVNISHSKGTTQVNLYSYLRNPHKLFIQELVFPNKTGAEVTTRGWVYEDLGNGGDMYKALIDEANKLPKKKIIVPEKKSAVKAKKDTAPKAKEKLTRVAKKPTPYTIAGTPVTEEEMSIAIRHALSIKPDLNTYDEYSTAMEKYNAKLENDGKKAEKVLTEKQWGNDTERVENIERRQQQREDKLLEAQKNEYKDKSFPVVLQDALAGDKSAQAILNEKMEDAKDTPIEDREDDRFYPTEEDWIQAAREVDSAEVPDTPEVKVEKATKGKEATKKAKATKVAKKQKRIANVRLAPLKKQLNSLKSQNAYMQEEVDKFKEGDQESPGLLKEIAKNEAEISRIEEEINQINPEEIEVEKETKKLSKKEQAAVDLEADLENYQEGGQNVVVDSVQEVTGEDFTQMDILSDQDIADSDYYELSLVNNTEQIVDAEKMGDPKKMATHIWQVKENIAKVTDDLTDRSGALPTEVVGYVEDLTQQQRDEIKRGLIESGQTEEQAEGNLQRVAALYTNNRVYIIASRVRSRQAGIRAWLHEQVGHNGLSKLFSSDSDFRAWANSAFDALVKDPTFKPIMEEVRGRYTTAKSFGSATTEQRTTMVIESMARYSEGMGTEVREGIIERLRAFLERLFKRLNIQHRLPTVKDAKALMEASHYNTLKGKHFAPVRQGGDAMVHASLFGEVAKRFSIDPMALIDARHEMEWNNPVTKKGTTFRGALMHAHEIKDVLMSRIGVIKNQVDEGLYTAMGIKFDPNTIDIRTGIISYRTTDVIKTGDAVNLFRDSLTAATPDRQQLVLDYKAKLESAVKSNSYDKLADTTKVEAKEQLDLINRAMNLSPKLKAFSETITPLYEEMFNLAKAAGIQMEHVDAYGKRVWKARKGQEDIWNSGFGKGLRAKLTSQNKRTFTSIVEGWEQGMKLQVGGVSDNLHAYATELVNVMANMKYVDYGMNLKDSTGRPLFAKGLTEQAAKSMGYRKVKGAIFEKYDLYAPKQAADYISVSGGSVISDNTVLDKILKFQVNVKSMILSGTPFHYFAGARSWVFGIGDKKKYAEALKKAKADPNLDTSNVAETIGKLMFGGPKQAYKQGLKSIRASAPIYELLVRNGLTQETARDVNYGDGNLIMKLGNKLGYAGVYSAGRELQVFNQNLQRNLFQKYFAGLKSQGAIASFLIEKFKAETKKNRTLNPQEVDKLAEGVAIKINADFGGLHLKRLGRNPTLQKLAQAVLLAPDWTESNFRTVTGALGLNHLTTKLGIDMIPEPEGIGGIYRGFWAKALPKIVAGTALSIAIGLLTSDPDDNEDYMKNVFWAGKMYASPISGLYDFLGISTKGASPYANLVAGHFADPLKLLNPVKLIKGKISPFARALDEVMWSQTDYRGVPFKTTGEFAEGVLKGDFGTTKASPYELKEDSISTILPTLIHVGKSMLPIPIQGTMKFLEGESDGLSAVFQAAGIHKGTGWDQQKEVKAMEDISSEIGAIDQKIKDATMIGNREMLAEGRKEKLQYKGFWTIKSRLNAVKNRIKPINRQLKKLKVISKARDWTHQEELQYRMLKKKKVKYIKPLLKVYNRYQ